MLLYFALGFIALLVLGGFKRRYDALKFGREMGQRIQAMEAKYEEYIEQKLTYQAVEGNGLGLDVEILTAAVVQVLQPDLDGVVNLINTAYLGRINIKYEAKYFTGLQALCEEGFKMSRLNKEKCLTEQDKALLEYSLQDAIAADLQHRLLSK